MALSTHWYTKAFVQAFTAKYNWIADAIKVALFTSSYTPAQGTDATYSSLTNEVANGLGYTTGGVALGSPTNTSAGLTATLSGANVTWTSTGAGFSAAYAVIYDSTQATNNLIAYVDLGGSQAVAGGAQLQLQWSGSGILAVTVS